MRATVAFVRWAASQAIHNTGREPAARLRFHGVDIGYPRPGIEQALGVLQQKEPALAAACSGRLDLNVFSDRDWGLSLKAYEGLSPQRRDELGDGLARLLAALDELRPAAAAGRAGPAVAWARRWARSALQSHRMFVAMAEGAWLDAINLRDRAMAEQLLWLASEVHPDARIVLWAHNGHVARTTRSVPDERLRGRMIPMGRHLARELGDSLVVVGFACGAGRDRDLDVEVDLGPVEPDSLDGALSRVGPQRFVLDLRRAPAEGPVRAWLSRPHRIRYMGSYEEMVPIEAFDAVFFVDTASPTRPRPAALARFRAGP